MLSRSPFPASHLTGLARKVANLVVAFMRELVMVSFLDELGVRFVRPPAMVVMCDIIADAIVRNLGSMICTELVGKAKQRKIV